MYSSVVSGKSGKSGKPEDIKHQPSNKEINKSIVHLNIENGPVLVKAIILYSQFLTPLAVT